MKGPGGRTYLGRDDVAGLHAHVVQSGADRAGADGAGVAACHGDWVDVSNPCVRLWVQPWKVWLRTDYSVHVRITDQHRIQRISSPVVRRTARQDFQRD